MKKKIILQAKAWRMISSTEGCHGFTAYSK